jgi:hypothetical protein
VKIPKKDFGLDMRIDREDTGLHQQNASKRTKSLPQYNSKIRPQAGSFCSAIDRASPAPVKNYSRVWIPTISDEYQSVIWMLGTGIYVVFIQPAFRHA